MIKTLSRIQRVCTVHNHLCQVPVGLGSATTSHHSQHHSQTLVMGGQRELHHPPAQAVPITSRKTLEKLEKDISSLDALQIIGTFCLPNKVSLCFALVVLKNPSAALCLAVTATSLPPYSKRSYNPAQPAPSVPAFLLSTKKTNSLCKKQGVL